MPETAIAAAPPASAAPQPSAQPAPQSTAPAGIPTQVVDPAISQEAARILGAEPGHGRPEPASVEDFEGAEGQPAIEPGQPGDPNAGGAAQGVDGAAQPQPESIPAFGEDFLKELSTVLPPEEAAAPQPVQEPDLTKPEELEKITNPDGKADLETRFKNAQSYIGKLQQQSGEKIKALTGNISQLMEGKKQLDRIFQKDQSGTLRASADGILDVSLLAPQHEMEQALAKRGVKLVPIDAKIEVGDDPAVSAWETEWANAAVPGNEQTVAEKLEQIQGDAKLNRRMTLDQAEWQGQRRAQQTAQREKVAAQQREESRKDQELVNGFTAALEQKPDFKTVLLPALKRANALIPNQVRGQQRLNLMNILMHAMRFPNVAKDIGQKAYAQGRKDAFAARSMGAIPAAGEQPDLTTGDLDTEVQPGQTATTQMTKEAEKVLGARAGRI